LRKAIKLSKEEEQLRESQNVLFDTGSQPNLIDTSDSFPQQQNQFGAQYQQVQQTPFGYQPAMSTGMLQNAYATGGGLFPNQTGYPQQFPQQTGYQMQQATGLYPQQQQQQQPFATGYGAYDQQAVYSQQQQPEPLMPLKTGSNNPFAQTNALSRTQPTSISEPSLNDMRQQHLQQQQQQQQPLRPQRTNNFDEGHMNELNTLLATGEGIDTFGNVGDLRLPAHHTKSTYVNSAGLGLSQMTGGGGQSNNPFLGQQYTGIATTNPIQPAFTGYGFGNAAQSQQAYQAQQNQRNQSLIDI
jgi:epsin